jgi:putative ABC transport system permease protein
VRVLLLRRVLVLAEVALALVLLVSAGLLIRSFLRLTAIDPGFNPEGVVAMDLSPPEQKYADPDKQVAFFHELMERVHSVPGVEKAATVSPLPLGGPGMVIAYVVEGRPVPNPSQTPSSNVRIVTPEVFQTLGIPLVKGRAFTDQDNDKAPPVVLVNETMAARVWPGEDAIGKRLTFDVPVSDQSQWATVIGITRDIKHRTLTDESGMEAYWPVYQRPFPLSTLVVRAKGDPTRLVGQLREQIRAVDRDLPAYQVRTMNEVVKLSLAQSRSTTVIFAVFAGLALILASVGVYGVVSYAVTQRTHEIGIRMALGAHRNDVLGMVIRQGMMVALIGVGVGLVVAFLVTKQLASMIYGVSTKDPLTFVAVPLTLALVALLANYLPARKATRVDPLVALRRE